MVEDRAEEAAENGYLFSAVKGYRPVWYAACWLQLSLAALRVPRLIEPETVGNTIPCDLPDNATVVRYF